MRRRIALVVAVAALGTAPVAASQATADPAHISCTSARIGGQHKCIARGQFCSRSRNKDYKRYGYSCSKRDKNGRYHLTYY